MDTTNKPKLDPEVKVELLIKLAFGISMDKLAEEYDLTRAKIINLRKNNYLMYNDFLEHWKIDFEDFLFFILVYYKFSAFSFDF